MAIGIDVATCMTLAIIKICHVRHKRHRVDLGWYLEDRLIEVVVATLHRKVTAYASACGIVSGELPLC
jgi:hypothetical protein